MLIIVKTRVFLRWA